MDEVSVTDPPKKRTKTTQCVTLCFASFFLLGRSCLIQNPFNSAKVGR